jgi:hypothetical protein
MVVAVADPPGGSAARKLGNPQAEVDWLIGQNRSLYWRAGRDPEWRGPETSTDTPNFVHEKTTVWYLPCGNWNGMTSPPT